MKKLTIIAVKKIAKDKGVALDKTAKKLDIIRAIQIAEGNNPCVGTSTDGSCEQMSCCWRPDCLGC